MAEHPQAAPTGPSCPCWPRSCRQGVPRSWKGSGASLVARPWQGHGAVGRWRRESDRRQVKRARCCEPRERAGEAGDAVPQATLAFPRHLRGARSHLPGLTPLSRFIAPWAVPVWPEGSVAAVPRVWRPAQGPWQAQCQPHLRGAVLPCPGSGGALPAEAAAGAPRGLGWAPSAGAGLWGCPPGQEPCSGTGTRMVVALQAGLEPGVCLQRKRSWAGVRSTGSLQIAPYPAPVLKTQTHTSFSGGFPFSLHNGP